MYATKPLRRRVRSVVCTRYVCWVLIQLYTIRRTGAPSRTATFYRSVVGWNVSFSRGKFAERRRRDHWKCTHPRRKRRGETEEEWGCSIARRVGRPWIACVRERNYGSVHTCRVQTHTRRGALFRNVKTLAARAKLRLSHDDMALFSEWLNF